MQNEAVPPTRYLTPYEVAHLWQVSQRTVMRLLWSGELDGIKVKGQWRVPAEAVDRYVAKAATR